jgi:hypothetical protein
LSKPACTSKSVISIDPRASAASTMLVVKAPGAAADSKPMCIEGPQGASQRPKDEALAAFVGGSTDRFNLTLLRQSLGTVWLEPGVSQEQIIGALADAIAAFQPRDAVEAMLASLAVAHHNMAMECLRRAMLPEQSAEAASRLRQDAVRSTRVVAEIAEAIDRRRGKGQQTVRVEHVTVQAGGQAIVGQVTPSDKAVGGGRRRRK